MGKIVRPVFGKPCYDCGDQVPHARVRLLENDAAAAGHRLAKSGIVCVNCKSLRENEIRRQDRINRGRETLIVSTVPRKMWPVVPRER